MSEFDHEENKRIAPIVMIGYMRSLTMRRSLLNLSRCRGFAGRKIYVFIDAPAREEHRAAVEEMVSAVKTAKTDAFPQLELIVRERNFGCPGNVMAAITEVLNRHGRAIFFEDDVLVSPSFLEYMDEGLERYEMDKRIFCINGWRDPLKSLPWNLEQDVYLSPRNCAWGVGLWKDRWDAVDFALSDWNKFRLSPENLRKLNKPGHDIRAMLESEVENGHTTWDVECTYHMVKNGLFAVEPKFSLTKNIGFGVESVHSGWRDYNVMTQRYYDFRPNFPDRLEVDPRILATYECQSEFLWFWAGVKRVLRRHIVRWFGKHDEPIVIDK